VSGHVVLIGQHCHWPRILPLVEISVLVTINTGAGRKVLPAHPYFQLQLRLLCKKCDIWVYTSVVVLLSTAIAQFKYKICLEGDASGSIVELDHLGEGVRSY